MVLLLLIPLLFVYSFADGVTTINGSLNLNYNGVNQNQSSNQGLSSNSNINITLEDTDHHSVRYGLKSGIYQYFNGIGDGKASGVGRTFGFVANQYGELNIGSNFGVGHMLQANNFMISEYDGITNFILGLMQDKKGNYIYIPGLLTNQLRNANQYIAGANLSNKISYISPTIHNFIFGFSYIPNNNEFIILYDKGNNIKPPAVKNVGQFGVTYRKQFDDIGLKLSFAIENGQILQDNIEKKYKNSFTSWDLGAHLSYMGFGFGLSHGENFSSPNNTYYNNGKYWLGGISYSISSYSIALSHLYTKNGESNIRKNSVAIGYKILKNAVAYTELAHFNIEDGVNKTEDTLYALMMGMKVQF